MPRGVYKRKKTKAQRRAIAARAAETRRANKEAAQANVQLASKPKSKRFLSDEEKGHIVAHFFSQPGRTFDSYDAVAAEIKQQVGVAVSGKQAERLREAFSLPFDVQGKTDSDAVCEKRLARIEQMLQHIQAQMARWE